MLLFFALIARQAFKSLTSRKKSFLGGNEPGTNRRCDWPISVQLHYHGTSSLARLNITSPSLSSSSSSARRQLFFDIIIDPSPPHPRPLAIIIIFEVGLFNGFNYCQQSDRSDTLEWGGCALRFMEEKFTLPEPATPPRSFPLIIFCVRCWGDLLNWLTIRSSSGCGGGGASNLNGQWIPCIIDTHAEQYVWASTDISWAGLFMDNDALV